MKVMLTEHRIINKPSQRLEELSDASIQLVVTSPPYPMIEMWDEIFGKQNPKITQALSQNYGDKAFELMHAELDKVWFELSRVLIPGGFVCINVGDATRTLESKFKLYSNHSRIIDSMQRAGFDNLPNILWRKRTNAPNKFMGSGMLPAGAYVTLEHEWILIFRRRGKRAFHSDIEKENRRHSSFFWEERNQWFSDMWEILGTNQTIKNTESRKRNAAYPFEIPYRLINMFSVYGDTVLDPFLGTGTTTLASIASGRNSIGYDVDEQYSELSKESINLQTLHELNEVVTRRLSDHESFIKLRNIDPLKSDLKYLNEHFGTGVMTQQETDMVFYKADSVGYTSDAYVVSHSPLLKESDFKFKPKTSNLFQTVINF